PGVHPDRRRLHAAARPRLHGLRLLDLPRQGAAGRGVPLAVEAMKVVHPGQGCEGLVATPALESEPRMNVHENARMTVHGRALLVSRVLDVGWTVAAASDAAGCSERTGYKWLARYRAGGAPALKDRSSTPMVCPHRLPAATVTEIERLRRQRLTGPQ